MQRCCPPARVVAKSFDHEAALFKAVGARTGSACWQRWLAPSPKSASATSPEALPLNQPTVSHHLRILREAGLVRCERRGTWVYYRLEPGAYDRIEAALGNILKQKVPA